MDVSLTSACGAATTVGGGVIGEACAIRGTIVVVGALNDAGRSHNHAMHPAASAASMMASVEGLRMAMNVAVNGPNENDGRWSGTYRAFSKRNGVASICAGAEFNLRRRRVRSPHTPSNKIVPGSGTMAKPA